LATAQDNKEQKTDVSVTVDSQTQLDVRPSFLSYSSVAPGEMKETSDNEQGFSTIVAENIGSQRIKKITAESTMPRTNPFGDVLTGSSTSDYEQTHDTGNFIQLGVQSANDLTSVTDEVASQVNSNDAYNGYPPHYVNRVEFFEENYPDYIEVDSTGTFGEDFLVGRIREGDVEYFIEVKLDDTSDPVVSEVRIGSAPHTSTQLGTTDFRSSSNGGTETGEVIVIDSSTISDDSGNSNYDVLDNALRLVSFNTEAESTSYSGESLLQAGTSGSLATEVASGVTLGDYDNAKVTEYSLFIHPQNNTVSVDGSDVEEVPHMFRTRFGEDIDSPSEQKTTGTFSTIGTVASGQEPIFSGSNTEDQLQPGQNFPIDVGIELPQGVDQAAITEGSVTLFATTGSAPS